MTTEFSEYLLPAHWAPALVNGDITGLEEGEEEVLMRVIVGEGLSDAVSCSDDPEFRVKHDASAYGVLACDCLLFTFPGC